MAAGDGQYAEEYPLKIINAGWYKCGSKSLSIALKILCISTCHDLTDSMDLLAKKRNWFTANGRILSRIEMNDKTLNYDDWLNEMGVDAVMDFPVVFIWNEIFERYPKAKVILLIRDEKDIGKWIESYLNLLKQINRFHMMYKVINMVYTVKSFQFEMDVWNRYHGGNLSKFLSLRKSDQAMALRQKYVDHIQKVKDTVPSKQLLIMNVKEGWRPLCEFLDKQVPDKAFPNVNSTKEFNRTSRRDLLLLAVTVSIPLVASVAISWKMYKLYTS